MLPSLPQVLRLLWTHIYPSPLHIQEPPWKKNYLITKAELYYFMLKYIILTELCSL